ncbi:MAG: hypothetical protein RMK29_21635 [Myxococcales bacterium]|nr:hypothetical protein [Myxococcota bacterium]MDW8284315.1 hypothetical protein [Myxococcales bacterium]
MPPYSPGDSKASGAQPTWVVGAPVDPESRIGKLIEGEYRIQSILGQGELGVSYQAYNARLKRSFAVLMLDRRLNPTHEMMLAVRADLRRAQALSHLGIIPIKQVTDDDGIPGFATELLVGETLRQRLAQGPLPAERALSLIVQLARALEAAHASGLIHGDLRPESIFLVRSDAKSRYAGRAVLLKHSLRHLRRRPVGFDDSLPLSKLMYRPPEQVAGEVLAADVSGDIFTLGGILHECLTGKPAFGGEDVEAVLDRLAGPPAILRENPDIGLTASLAEGLNVVISGACARDPQARIPTMGDLLRALLQVAAGAGITPSEIVSEPPSPSQARGRISLIFRRLSGAFPSTSPRPVPERRAEPVAPVEPPGPQGPEVARPPAAEPAKAAHPPPPETDRPVEAVAPAPEREQPIQPPPSVADGTDSQEQRTPVGVASPSLAEQHTQPPRPRDTVLLSQPVAEQEISQRPTVALSRLRLTQNLPLSQRPTRQLRARDITQLVAAVQAGRLDPSQAVALAREPEEIELDDQDLESALASSRPTMRSIHLLRLLRPTVRQRRRVMYEFLLRHQELVAALVGAGTILLLGLLVLRCR